MSEPIIPPAGVYTAGRLRAGLPKTYMLVVQLLREGRPMGAVMDATRLSYAAVLAIKIQEGIRSI